VHGIDFFYILAEMTENELKALVSLLEDEDKQISTHVQEKILSLGTQAIPFLEKEWESNLNPSVQSRIEELIHTLQYELVKERLKAWYTSPDQDLLTGMWIIATYQYPDIELEKLKQELEQVYYETWLEFRPDLYAFDQVKVVNSVIFNNTQGKPHHLVRDLPAGCTKAEVTCAWRKSSQPVYTYL
jgi:hypothetical protein